MQMVVDRWAASTSRQQCRPRRRAHAPAGRTYDGGSVGHVLCDEREGRAVGMKHAIPGCASGRRSIVTWSRSTPSWGRARHGVRRRQGRAEVSHPHGRGPVCGRNIRVNGVFPGFVETGMTRDFIQAENRNHRIASRRSAASGARGHCLRHRLSASDESSYMTGSELVIDGGISRARVPCARRSSVISPATGFDFRRCASCKNMNKNDTTR